MVVVALFSGLRSGRVSVCLGVDSTEVSFDGRSSRQGAQAGDNLTELQRDKTFVIIFVFVDSAD
jgi:hypothetical protein